MAEAGGEASLSVAKDMGAFLAKPSTIRLMLHVSLETLKLYITYKTFFCNRSKGYVYDYDPFLRHGYCRRGTKDEIPELDELQQIDTFKRILYGIKKNEKTTFNRLDKKTQKKLNKKIQKDYVSIRTNTSTKKTTTMRNWLIESFIKNYNAENIGQFTTINTKSSDSFIKRLGEVKDTIKKILDEQTDIIIRNQVWTKKDQAVIKYNDQVEKIQKYTQYMNKIESRLAYDKVFPDEDKYKQYKLTSDEKKTFNQDNMNRFKTAIDEIKNEKSYKNNEKKLKSINEYKEIVDDIYEFTREIIYYKDKIIKKKGKETDFFINYNTAFEAKIEKDGRIELDKEIKQKEIQEALNNLPQKGSKTGGKNLNKVINKKKTIKKRKLKKNRTIKR